MTTALIPINYDGEQPTVSARALHTGLGIRSNFTTWFDRMCEYGFTEVDYKKCFPNLESGSSKNMPTQKSMELGLLEIKEGSYINGAGVNVTTKTPKVTGKGRQYFINKFLAA